ncbi:hypothetical protein K504DRAFT_460113 [Pleomassaria siparia CBS 279.74]|uniref:Uncharacterized protein n=1 Tax=Pleomassaria siparia CBS 279.74 TaxID=1314801 RepID=A0A6G1K096_9PLEO|nr:hypothetical protein K504DRAFT_460113 [Pleomassaria siparia CBS 279.74]
MRSTLSVYSIALLALPLISPVFCHEPASPTQDINAKPIYSNANEAFQDLLNALPEESLHVALNSLTKFKDGVFESDRHGVEHVHHDNPPLATKLIVAAVQDLKNRQAPPATNGTSVVTTPPPQTSEPSTPQSSSQAPPQQSSLAPSQAPSQQSSVKPSQAQSSQAQSSQAQSSQAPPPAASSSSAPTESAVVIPVKVTTTDTEGKTTVATSVILSKATAFVPVDVTITDVQGSTIVTQTIKPAVIYTTTDSSGSAVVATSAADFAPTAGQVMTSTDAQGSTVLTTYTPGGGRVSSILLITTTGENGSPTVVTSYTYVDPAAATQTSPPAASGTTKGKPGLQTNAARHNLVMEMALVGGAVGGWFALFV